MRSSIGFRLSFASAVIEPDEIVAIPDFVAVDR
jgi:hypothetical protein